MKNEIQGNQNDNNLILSQMLRDEIKQARDKRYPSAESILNNLGDLRIK
jgi:hypothetical protein